MQHLEYLLSVLVALALLGGITAWTHADYAEDEARFSCQRGQTSPAVTMKGMVIYPRCAPRGRS